MPTTKFNPRSLPHTPESKKRLGAILRTLTKASGLKAYVVASEIGMTPVGLSNIFTGESCPQPAHFKELYKLLCKTDDEKKLLMEAYQYPQSADCAFEVLPETPSAQTNHVKARMKMNKRAKEITLKKAVREALVAAEIPYIEDYVIADIAIDFLIKFQFEAPREEPSPSNGYLGVSSVEKEFALLIDGDPETDKIEATAMADYVRTNLWLERAIVVVPYIEKTHYHLQQNPRKSVLNERVALEYLCKVKQMAIEDSERS
jgi:hypothetical protein